MGVERIDYSSQSEYEQALAYEQEAYFRQREEDACEEDLAYQEWCEQQMREEDDHVG